LPNTPSATRLRTLTGPKTRTAEHVSNQQSAQKTIRQKTFQLFSGAGINALTGSNHKQLAAAVHVGNGLENAKDASA
jgi:hypothetical protein